MRVHLSYFILVPHMLRGWWRGTYKAQGVPVLVAQVTRSASPCRFLGLNWLKCLRIPWSVIPSVLRYQNFRWLSYQSFHLCSNERCLFVLQNKRAQHMNHLEMMLSVLALFLSLTHTHSHTHSLSLSSLSLSLIFSCPPKLWSGSTCTRKMTIARTK